MSVPVDTIVLATGFDTSRSTSRAIDVTGAAAATRRRVDDGAQAYLGITTAGFPNLFQLYGPNTNNGSILFMLECQVEYIARQLQRMDRRGSDDGSTYASEVHGATTTSRSSTTSTASRCGAGCNNYYRVRPAASSRNGRTA